MIQTCPISLMIRLGGPNTIAVVKMPKRMTPPMSLFNHNGLDVTTREEVDECYRIAVEQKEKWGLGEETGFNPNDVKTRGSRG